MEQTINFQALPSLSNFSCNVKPSGLYVMGVRAINQLFKTFKELGTPEFYASILPLIACAEPPAYMRRDSAEKKRAQIMGAYEKNKPKEPKKQPEKPTKAEHKPKTEQPKNPEKKPKQETKDKQASTAIYKEVQRYNTIIDTVLASDLPDKMEIARIVDLHKKQYESKHHFIGK